MRNVGLLLLVFQNIHKIYFQFGLINYNTESIYSLQKVHIDAVLVTNLYFPCNLDTYVFNQKYCELLSIIS